MIECASHKSPSYCQYLAANAVNNLSRALMGHTRLTIAERQIHLRMKARGHDVRAIADATGNSATSIYETFRLHAANRPLMPPISCKVGRPRKLCNDDVEVCTSFLSSTWNKHRKTIQYILSFLSQRVDSMAFELVRALHDVRGVDVSESTVLNYLARRGVTRKKVCLLLGLM